jgi:hypothetical protein
MEAQNLEELIQNLYQEIHLLKQSQNQQSQSTQPSTIKEPKVNSPEPFTGNRNKTRNFLVQMEIVFNTQPTRFPNDKAKVMYFGSFLRDSAASWFTPFVEKNDAILSDYSAFLQDFKISYCHPDSHGEASRKIKALKQGNQPVSTLAAEFRRLATELDWTQNSLMDAFYNALLDRVKDKISEDERPATLNEFINKAIKIDDRQFQRIQEKRAQSFSQGPPKKFISESSNSQRTHSYQNIHPNRKETYSTSKEPTPMILDSGRRKPLSQSDKEYRRANNLCLYCGNSGHILSQCPVRPPSSWSKNGPGKDSKSN